MNPYRSQALALKHQLRRSAELEGNPAHIKHVEDFLKYAEIMAMAAAQDAIDQMLRKTNTQKGTVEIDQVSVAKMKKALQDAFSSIAGYRR